LDAQRQLDPSLCTDLQYGDYVWNHQLFVTRSDYQRGFLGVVDTNEAIYRHRLVAVLKTFDATSGHHGKLHLGMTSHDVEETTEHHLTYRSVGVLLQHLTACIAQIADLCDTTAEQTMVGRTHGQPAQVTTVGRRLANHLEQLIEGHRKLHVWQQMRPARPVAGAVGTYADMQAILDSPTRLDMPIRPDPSRPDKTPEWSMYNPLGCDRLEIAPQQCSDRLWLHDLGSVLTRVAYAAAKFATTVRLMAMQGLAQEQPTEEQVGSSAMPHKRNPRYSERIVAQARVVAGYARMLSDSALDTWLENDVAGSAVQRQALPEMLQQADSQLLDLHWVARRFQPDDRAIADEVAQYAPVLASGQLLAAAVRTGMSRERAHDQLQRHLGFVWEFRHDNADPVWPLGRPTMRAVVDDPARLGSAVAQTRRVVKIARGLCGQHDGAGLELGERL
jgi:adenylosuccinate lyase